MTADLKAARARTRSLAERFRRGEVIGGTFYATETADHLDDILTALDQAAEALRPFGRMWAVGSWPLEHEGRTYRTASRASVGLSDDGSLQIGDVERAATVYATLKPVDTKEGEGA